MRNACSQVVRQLKGILDGEAMLRPGLALPRQAFGVPDADHILLPVEHLGVVAQKAEPELPNRLPVPPVIGPHARQVLGVLAVEPAVPAVDAQAGLPFGEALLAEPLQAGEDGRRRVHQEVDHHDYVRVAGQGAAGGVADATDLGEVFDDVAEHFGSLVYFGVGSQEGRVLQGQRVVQADVPLNVRFLVSEFDDGHFGVYSLLDHVKVSLAPEQSSQYANNPLQYWLLNKGMLF